MAKRYIRINFQNSPSTVTPLNATNLNKVDKGIDDCDNAIEDLYSVKIDKSSIVQTTAVNDANKVPSSAVSYSLAQSLSALNDNLANSFTVTDISSLLLPGWESFDANTKPMLIKVGKLCLIRGILRCTDISKGGILGNLPVLPTTYAGSICECFTDKAISSIYVTTYPNAGLVYQNQGGRALTLNASYIINATYYSS